MLGLAIYSATIACLVKEERQPGMVWTQGDPVLQSRLDHDQEHHGIMIKNIMATSIMLTHQEVGFTRDKVRVQDGSKHQVFFLKKNQKCDQWSKYAT